MVKFSTEYGNSELFQTLKSSPKNELETNLYLEKTFFDLLKFQKLIELQLESGCSSPGCDSIFSDSGIILIGTFCEYVSDHISIVY